MLVSFSSRLAPAELQQLEEKARATGTLLGRNQNTFSFFCLCIYIYIKHIFINGLQPGEVKQTRGETPNYEVEEVAALLFWGMWALKRLQWGGQK